MRHKAALLALLLALSGCAKICPGMMGPGAILCAPYDIVTAPHFAKEVYSDTKPGGMLNPHGSKTGISNKTAMEEKGKAGTAAMSNAGSAAVITNSAKE